MKNLILFFVFIVCSFMVPGGEESVQKKIFRQDGYDIECFVYIREDKRINSGRIYSWYRSQKIHETMGQSGGNLLHGEFKKYDRLDQLVEHGTYHYGLKKGIWREWYPSGVLKRKTKFRNGYRQGKEILFDQDGKIIMEGRFSKNKKSGEWINYNLSDTLFYKNDSIYDTKPKNFIGRFFKNVFERDSVGRAQRKLEKLEKKEQDSLKRVKKKAAKEQIRLQKKKEKEEKKLKNNRTY